MRVQVSQCHVPAAQHAAARPLGAARLWNVVRGGCGGRLTGSLSQVKHLGKLSWLGKQLGELHRSLHKGPVCCLVPRTPSQPAAALGSRGLSLLRWWEQGCC